MTEASNAREPTVAGVAWLLTRRDPLTQTLLILVAVSVAAAAGEEHDVLAWLGRAAGVLATTLVLIAAGHGRSLISDRHEQPFWNEIVVALACWWLATLLRLLTFRSWLPAEIAASVFLGLTYFFLIAAAERQPHRRVRWRPVGLERMLSWPAVALFVLGLFLYFVLVPVLAGKGAADVTRPYPAFALVLDLYLAVQLLYLALETRGRRWRMVYGLLAATLAAWLLGDLARLLRSAAGVTALWTGLGYLTAFVAVRGGQLFVAGPPEEALDPRPEIAIPATIRTVVAALSFPVVHIVGYAAGWLDPADETTRERLVFVWLLLLGAIALLQHRLLRVRTEQLWRERERAEKALRKNEQNLRLMIERRSAAEAIRASQDRFAKVFRACPSSMVISRLLDGRVLEVNDSFGRMTGYAPSEVLGRGADELDLWCRPADREDLLEALRREEVVRNRRYRFRRKDGEEHVMLIDAVELELDGDRCLLSMARDVTALATRHPESDDEPSPAPDEDRPGAGGEGR